MRWQQTHPIRQAGSPLPCLLDVAMHGVPGIALHLKQLLSCFPRCLLDVAMHEVLGIALHLKKLL